MFELSELRSLLSYGSATRFRRFYKFLPIIPPQASELPGLRNYRKFPDPFLLLLELLFVFILSSMSMLPSLFWRLTPAIAAKELKDSLLAVVSLSPRFIRAGGSF